MQFFVDPPITVQFLFDPFRLGRGGGVRYRILGEYRDIRGNVVHLLLLHILALILGLDDHDCVVILRR